MCPLEAVQAVDHVPGLLRDRDLFEVRIAHRGPDVRVAKDGSHLIDRETVLDEPRGMGVAQRVDRAVMDAARQSG